MVRFVLSAAFMVGLTSMTLAAVDPNAPVPAAVVSECSAVEAATSGTGLCVGATQDFITALQANGVTGSALDDQLINLTTELATLAAGDEACNATDSEVAQAIALASSYVSDPGQAAALAELSETVGACEGGGTGELPDFVSPVG